MNFGYTLPFLVYFVLISHGVLSSSISYWNINSYVAPEQVDRWNEYLSVHIRWFGLGSLPQRPSVSLSTFPSKKFTKKLQVLPVKYPISQVAPPSLPEKSISPTKRANSSSESSSFAIVCGSDLQEHCVSACSEACSGSLNGTSSFPLQACANSCATGCTDPSIAGATSIENTNCPVKSEICSKASAKVCTVNTEEYCSLGEALLKLTGGKGTATLRNQGMLSKNSIDTRWDWSRALSPKLHFQKCAYAVSYSCVKTFRQWDGKTCIVARSYSSSYADEFAKLYGRNY